MPLHPILRNNLPRTSRQANLFKKVLRQSSRQAKLIDHFPSVLRARCPAHFQCFLLIAETQSSKPALWQCSSAKCVVRRIQSTQTPSLALASILISSGSVLMSQDEDDEPSFSKLLFPVLQGVVGIGLLPAPKIPLSMRRCGSHAVFTASCKSPGA